MACGTFTFISDRGRTCSRACGSSSTNRGLRAPSFSPRSAPCAGWSSISPRSVEDNPEVGSIVLDGPFEINGISGEVWRDGAEIRVHLHGSVTREAGTLYGGGLGEGAVVLKLAEMIIAGIK